MIDEILEWIGGIGEGLTGIFDDMGEFSIGGLIFALLVFAFIFILRDQMLNPFLIHMGKAEAIFWGIATYLVSSIVGYMIGKKMFE